MTLIYSRDAIDMFSYALELELVVQVRETMVADAVDATPDDYREIVDGWVNSKRNLDWALSELDRKGMEWYYNAYPRGGWCWRCGLRPPVSGGECIDCLNTCIDCQDAEQVVDGRCETCQRQWIESMFPQWHAENDWCWNARMKPVDVSEIALDAAMAINDQAELVCCTGCELYHDRNDMEEVEGFYLCPWCWMQYCDLELNLHICPECGIMKGQDDYMFGSAICDECKEANRFASQPD